MPEPKPNVLGLIPARAGSKGIPGKNSRLLAGTPLLGRAVEFARASGCFDRIVVTTESGELAALGRGFGAETPFLRPAELATDGAPMLPVVQHAVASLSAAGWSPDIVVLLQPTAPFRRIPDLRAALDLLRTTPAADAVVSVEAIPGHFSPHWAMKIESGMLAPMFPDLAVPGRRQDVPRAYTRNGQFYVTRRATLLELDSIYGRCCLPYVTTHRAVNLDTIEDWAEAERLASAVFGPGNQPGPGP
jgi:N-acylneuraminate cytidylyltransferase